MTPRPEFERALDLAAKFGQEHLLRFYGELSPVERENLIAQILNVDFKLLATLRNDPVAEAGPNHDAESIQPLAARAWENFSLSERASMANQGMRALREGKVAAFLVAGGQGTRLGHDGPKGSLDIGLPSRKCLFQLQAERIRNLSHRAGRPILWYIMTSADNHADTLACFREGNFFGLPETDVFFFQQAQMPMTDFQGKILLAGKDRLALGPNGNGGCFPALARSGALEDMRRRGVEYVFFYSVDNALVRVCDPCFIGFSIMAGLPAASKAVAKTAPEEKVGVLCRRGGKPSVLEYSEMTADMVAARAADGRLLYEAANIAVHLFTRSFLEEHAGTSLPFHTARKKIPYVDETGGLIVPAEPNACKFELFMFDLFPKANDMAALLVKREEEFAPVKNRDGVDSPATARALILALHRRWALEAGITEAELGDRIVEISPLLSYAGEAIDPSAIRSRLGEAVIQVE